METNSCDKALWIEIVLRFLIPSRRSLAKATCLAGKFLRGKAKIGTSKSLKITTKSCWASRSLTTLLCHASKSNIRSSPLSCMAQMSSIDLQLSPRPQPPPTKILMTQIHQWFLNFLLDQLRIKRLTQPQQTTYDWTWAQTEIVYNPARLYLPR